MTGGAVEHREVVVGVEIPAQLQVVAVVAAQRGLDVGVGGVAQQLGQHLLIQFHWLLVVAVAEALGLQALGHQRRVVGLVQLAGQHFFPFRWA